ncbi:PAS domain-containing protein [Pseudomonas sp. NFACC36]|uniref:PAS domain-containing protein n=1 Tax=Pseudomonas sp. NFACC36 TaxID=1566197 RepID=UPI000911A152|nr:PAS domain-containing protein [Pseudomonas sp. NFACC36]SFX03161.1 PAS domain S-box-containing protein [Pseudomonas sp. NFACC36]
MINAQLMQLVINASNDGIVIAEKEGDEDNILIYVNPAFERLTGYSRDEILYQDCRFLQSGDRDQPSLEHIRETLKQGGACREVLRNYRKDGTPFWNELSLSAVKNAADGHTYFVGVQKDVTVQVRAQNRIAQLEKELADARATIARLEATNGTNKTAN